MSNRLDQLFKDTLSEHKVSPSAGAWEKVQSGLSKKNKILIAWRIAAMLALFGALVSAWYLVGREGIDKSRLTETEEVITPEDAGREKSKELTTESVGTKIDRKAKRSVTIKRKTETGKDEQGVVGTQNPTTEENESQTILATSTAAEQVLITESTKPEKPIVIEFTLETISITPTAEVAKITNEGNSGLKKILETAREVKNGESDFGKIWDTKNQLFALDFKKDKTKRN